MKKIILLILVCGLAAGAYLFPEQRQFAWDATSTFFMNEEDLAKMRTELWITNKCITGYDKTIRKTDNWIREQKRKSGITKSFRNCDGSLITYTTPEFKLDKSTDHRPRTENLRQEHEQKRDRLERRIGMLERRLNKTN